MAPDSSTLAWKISWTEEPGRLQSTGSRRVGHDLNIVDLLIGAGTYPPVAIATWGLSNQECVKSVAGFPRLP